MKNTMKLKDVIYTYNIKAKNYYIVLEPTSKIVNATDLIKQVVDITNDYGLGYNIKYIAKSDNNKNYYNTKKNLNSDYMLYKTYQEALLTANEKMFIKTYREYVKDIVIANNIFDKYELPIKLEFDVRFKKI